MAGAGFGQDNLQVQFGYRGSVAGAKYLPSTQILSDYKFESSFHYSTWVANTSLTYGSIRKIYKQNRLTREDVNNIVDELEPDNQLGVGQDFLILGFGLKTKIKQHPIVWSFTVSDRLNANAHIPKTLVQLAWQGNKQFEGQTLDLSKTNIVGLYFREFSFGLASDLAQWGNWNFRGGLRFNYYMGLSAINNTYGKFFFTTEAGAEKIVLDYDFEYYYTGIEDFNFFDPRGNGFGINLGTSFSYKDELYFDIGVTDLGYIKFEKKVTRIGSENLFEFTGLGLDAIVNPTAFLDSLEEVFQPVIDSLRGHSFKMPVGARLSFRTSWVFGRTNKINGPKTLSFYYSQGFEENPGVTLRPRFTLALHRPMFKHFLFGFSASYGGFSNFVLGGLIGMHWKHFRFSFQSDDFTGLIFPDSGTGGGGGFIFQMLF
jgi:hypothetical protein